jgi:hypothetical protein
MKSSTSPPLGRATRRPQAPNPQTPKPPTPPPQMYTDLRAELEDVQGGYCPGLEAAFGQLNGAFKRLTPPNSILPDGSAPPPGAGGVPLPWWDVMRYMWRGTAAVRVRGLTAVLATSDDPHASPCDPRLVLTAATLGLGCAAGRIDVTSTHMSAIAHGRAPDQGQGAVALGV